MRYIGDIIGKRVLDLNREARYSQPWIPYRNLREVYNVSVFIRDYMRLKVEYRPLLVLRGRLAALVVQTVRNWSQAKDVLHQALSRSGTRD